MRKYLCAALLALAGLLATGPAKAADEVRFNNILMGIPDEKAIELVGQIVKPDGDGPFPAVVILHSCGGMDRQVTDDWPDFLVKLGYVVLTVDSFGTRTLGKCPNALSLNKKTRRHMARDAYGALYYLATVPYVDAGRVGVMGFSLGGHAINLLAGPKFQKSYDKPKIQFRAGISFYGICKSLMKAKRIPFPLVEIVGDRDEKVKECLKIAKGPVEVQVIPGAGHAFDNLDVDYGVDGYGNPMGYDGAAATKSQDMVKAFLDAHVKNAPAGPQAVVRSGGRAVAAAGSSATDESGGGYMAGNAIRKALVGNTIRLDIGSKGAMFLYFEDDKRLAGAWAKNPSHVFHKKWWIAGKDVMCRAAGKDNHEVCAKIKAGADKTLKLFTPGGEPKYETPVMAGNRLPK